MAEILRRDGRVRGGPVDDRPIVDRASMLPIGQYEDGSFTFAWPGMFKDAWDSAQRTRLQSAHAPVTDDQGTYIGQYQARNTDPLNVASLPILGAGAARGAGMLLANDARASLPAIAADALDFTPMARRVPRPPGDEGTAVPSIKVNGQEFRGPPGGTHADAYEAAIAALGEDAVNAARIEDGFSVGSRFLTRDEASAVIGARGRIDARQGSDLKNIYDELTGGGASPLAFANPPESSLPYLLGQQEQGENEQPPSMSSVLRRQ